MKIIVTGSLGHVSKPLTQQLIEKAHDVTVITRSAEKQKEIEALGAKAAIGSMDDVDFLTDVFKGADAVYCVLVPSGGNFNNPAIGVEDIMISAGKIANNYVQAIRQSGIKHVVYLSSVGAHTNKENGLLTFHYNAENTLRQLPADVAIAFMRPVGFYDNLLNFINPIKKQGAIASNYGGDDKTPWVSPVDIATAVAEEITTPFTGRKVRYVASEELSCNEMAGILGEAIGKPDLKWILLTNEQQLNGMKAFGMNESIAESFVEMNTSIHNGKIYEDYNLHKPTLGKVKLKDFAEEFAVVYHQQ